MSMKRRVASLLLASFVCILPSALTSCDNESAFGLVGFDVEKTATTTFGSFYTAENFLLKDKSERYYKVGVSVIENKTQEEVLVVADTFRVESPYGYTIRYTVKKDGKELVKTTNVQVDMSDYVPISVNCPKIVDIGETVEIDVTARYGVENYSVSLQKDGESVVLNEGKFYAESTGLYTGKVIYALDYLEGKEKQKVYNFDILVRDPIQDALKNGISSPTADKGVDESQYEGWTTFTGWEGYDAYVGDVTIGGETKTGEFYSFKAFNWGGYVSFMPDYSMKILNHFANEGYFLEMEVGLQGLYNYVDNTPSTFKDSYLLSVFGESKEFKVNEWTTVKIDLRKYMAMAEGFTNKTLDPSKTGMLGYTWTVADVEDVYSNCYVTNFRLVNRLTEEGISSPVLEKGVEQSQYEGWTPFTAYTGTSSYVGDVTIGGEKKSGEFYTFKAFNWGGYVSLMPDCSVKALREFLAEGYSLQMDIGLQGLYNYADDTVSSFKSSYALNILGETVECNVNGWTRVTLDLEDYITLVEGFVNETLNPSNTGLIGYTWTEEDTQDVYTYCYVTNLRLVKL